MKKLTTLSILLISLTFVVPLQASAATSAGVKPGSFFYFFDTTFENVSLFFTFNPEKKAQKALAYADERLAEIETVAEEKNPDAVKTAIANYESNIALATEKSKEVKDNGQAETLLNSIADNASKNQEVLSAVLIKVPDEAKEAITQAIEASKKGQEEAIKQIAELKGEVEKLKNEVAELKKESNNPQADEVEKLKKEVEALKKQSATQSVPKQPTQTSQIVKPDVDNSSAIQAEVQRQAEAFFKAKQEQDALIAQQKAESDRQERIEAIKKQQAIDRANEEAKDAQSRVDAQKQQAQEKLEEENKLVAKIESQITSYLQKLETQILEVKQKIAIDEAIARSAANSASKSTTECQGTKTSNGCVINSPTISFNVGSAVNGSILAQLVERRNALNVIQSKLKESGSNGITESDKIFLTSFGISW